MSFLVLPGEAPVLTYAGRPLGVLAGLEGRVTGFAVAELTVAPGFPGPPPHVHDDFDEGFYVLEGTLVVEGDGDPLLATAGSMFVAPRGERHAFSNPSPSPDIPESSASFPRPHRMTAIGPAWKNTVSSTSWPRQPSAA